MFSKILISGEIELLTGMHTGTGGEYAAIDAVDSPVIKDKLTDYNTREQSERKNAYNTRKNV